MKPIRSFFAILPLLAISLVGCIAESSDPEPTDTQGGAVAPGDDGDATGGQFKPNDGTNSALPAPSENSQFWIWGSHFQGDTSGEPPPECDGVVIVSGVDMFADGGKTPNFTPSTTSTVIALSSSITLVGENAAWNMTYVLGNKEAAANSPEGAWAWYHGIDDCANAFGLIVPDNDPNWTGSGPGYSWFLVTPPPAE